MRLLDGVFATAVFVQNSIPTVQLEAQREVAPPPREVLSLVVKTCGQPSFSTSVRNDNLYFQFGRGYILRKWPRPPTLHSVVVNRHCGDIELCSTYHH